jgi:hypothetical protein
MTSSNRIAPSYPIANNKKPRPSRRKSGLIKLNFIEFVFIAYDLFSSKALRCDVGRSPGSLNIRSAFPSRCIGTVAERQTIRSYLKNRLINPSLRVYDRRSRERRRANGKAFLRWLLLEITVAGQLPTCPVRLVDGISRNSLFIPP